MEELRSTEALDREILEDARKKAFKILKTADDTLAAQKKDWDKKTDEAVNALRNNYSLRLKKIDNEIFARLPLDKRRLRSETAEAFLIKAMGGHLASLGREALLAILGLELSRRIEICAADLTGTKLELLFSGMELSEANKLLARALNSSKFDLAFSFKEAALAVFGDEKFSAIRGFPSIVINTENVKITASVESAAMTLLDDKRAELAEALLGEGALND